MSLSSNKLATAGPSGCVQIFQLDVNDLSQKGKGLEHLYECPIGESRVEWLPLSPPGLYISTVRIQHVEFSSASDQPHSFLACQGKRLFVWDMQAAKVLIDELVSDDLLNSKK